MVTPAAAEAPPALGARLAPLDVHAATTKMTVANEARIARVTGIGGHSTVLVMSGLRPAAGLYAAGWSHGFGAEQPRRPDEPADRGLHVQNPRETGGSGNRTEAARNLWRQPIRIGLYPGQVVNVCTLDF
jgi:hypothetical protein